MSPSGRPLKLVVWVLRAPGRALAFVLVGLVRAYQKCLSPLLPSTCRFRPTCSEYMIEAIRAKGPVLGLAKGLWRIARCNPFFPGGYDPVVKEEEEERD